MDFEGEWIHGKRTGPGVKVNTVEGSRSIGVFNDGALEGIGAVTVGKKSEESTPYEYHGEFKKGVRHGYGVMVIDKIMYSGEFVDGIKSGYGAVIFENEVEYTGNIENEDIQGVGKYDSARMTYHGMFVQGIQHGYGVMTMKDSTAAYEGMWENGQCSNCE